MKMSVGAGLAALTVAVALAGWSGGSGVAVGAGPTGSTTSPGAGLKPGWEDVDQRMVFFTVQLSTTETLLEATNKALRVNGYKQATRQADAARAAKGNELMDRNGGGPVPWQEFYGRTAEKFFYHPVDGNTAHLNPLPIDQRPPQFDYIYKANEQNREKAEEDAAKIGTKIDDLLAYRRQLESEQSALWCKIAFRGVASMELSTRPLYRLEMKAGGSDIGAETLRAAQAAVTFMRAVNGELGQAQKDLDTDQKGVFDHLLATTTAAREQLQTKLLDQMTVATALADPRSAIGQFSRSAKRMEDSAQNLVDAWKLASDADVQDDVTAKQNYRGQVQQMAFDYAAAVVTANDLLTRAVAEWKITLAGTKAEPAPAAENSADAIPGKLDAAKAQHQNDLTAARRALVAAVDARLNAAADAGDLAAVQSLQSVKMTAAHDGTIPEGVTDSAVLAARKEYVQASAAADARLVSAYKDAVIAYTKARRIPEAQATQDELNGLGLTAAGASAGGGAAAAVAEAGGRGGPEGLVAPTMTGEKMELDLPAPAEESSVGGGGRYLVMHLKKLQQLAIFDVNQLKVVKYLPLPTNDVTFAAGQKKLFVGLKDLHRIQRWDLAKLVLEQTAATAPEGGINCLATASNATEPVVLTGKKRIWLLNPGSLRAETYPSKNWGTEGSAWGPETARVSFDGSTVIAFGGGWAGIELSNIVGGKVATVEAGGYVHGDAEVAGNGELVFREEGKVLRSDLTTEVGGIEGRAFPADDAGFSLLFQSQGNRREVKHPELEVFSNSDPRPLATIRDLPELAGESKLPIPERVHLIIKAKVLITLKGELLTVRKFDLASAMDAEGLDYLFVESSPGTLAEPGSKYVYKLVVRSKKGDVKLSLQSGPPGMTLQNGVLQWQVPRRLEAPNATVIVQVSDASGQTMFHTFTINVATGGGRRER